MWSSVEPEPPPRVPDRVGPPDARRRYSSSRLWNLRMKPVTGEKNRSCPFTALFVSKEGCDRNVPTRSWPRTVILVCCNSEHPSDNSGLDRGDSGPVVRPSSSAINSLTMVCPWLLPSPTTVPLTGMNSGGRPDNSPVGRASFVQRTSANGDP